MISMVSPSIEKETKLLIVREYILLLNGNMEKPKYNSMQKYNRQGNWLNKYYNSIAQNTSK